MKETMAKALVPVRYRAELLAVIEQHHAAVRDFHLRRRVFVAMTEAEEQSAAALTQAQAAETAGLPHALVLAEPFAAHSRALQERILSLASDRASRVRFQAALTIGEFELAGKQAALLQILQQR